MMKRLMTLINHLPPFFRSLNARVKYFFFYYHHEPTLIVFISINCDFPRPTTPFHDISRRRVDGYIFYYPNEIRRILSTQKETLRSV